MKKVFLCGLFLLVALNAAAAPQGAKGAPTVTAHLDRTAVWVGDVLRYTLRVVHDANVELVLDNFTQDRLPMAPFVLRDIDIRRGEWAGGKRAASIALSLTSFETGKSELTLPSIQIFYFLREPGLAKKESPVQSIAVPAVKIRLGSTIAPAGATPRTVKALGAPGLAWPATALALGAAGLLLLVGYAALGIWRWLRPTGVARPLTRKARAKIMGERLARLRAELPAAGDDPRRWSASMATAVRGLVGELFQIPGVSLTPDEIEAALARSGLDAPMIAEIKTVLARCDELRYGKPAAGPEGLRGQLAQAVERIMQSRQLLSA